MKVVSILNQKGGTGKTSLTALISIALALKGKKVIVVDCDPQGGITSFLSPTEDEEKVRPGLFELLGGFNTLSEVMVTVERSGAKITLIPSDYRLDQISGSLDPYALKRKFKNLEGFDYLIFDNPPTVQGISRASCIMADRVYIPSDISAASYGPTNYTINSLKDIDKKGYVVFIGYKEPGEDNNGYMAQLSRKFMQKFKDNYAGTVPKTSTSARIIADPTVNLTQTKVDQYLSPILSILGE
jgi:cellulose biosynthesis protein BcsQ